MFRFFYICLLRLHPSRFRRRFAEEMLGIFDQSAGTRAAVPLLADAAVSLCRQWAFRQEFGKPAGVDVVAAHACDGVPVFYTCGSSIPPRGALLQGAVFSLAIFSAVCLLLGDRARHRTLLIGSHHPSPHLLPVQRPVIPSTDLTTEIEWEFPPDDDAARKLTSIYFRVVVVLETLDADHNLVISASEIANAPAALRKLDQNHDGKLNADECGQNFGNTARGAVRPTGAGIPKPAAGQKVSRAEAKADLAFLKRARLGFMRLHPVLAALDADHDGEISATEAENASAALKSLDKNGDGQLTPDEVLPDPVANQVVLFMSLDKNGDGNISKDERVGAYAELFRDLLDSADRNHDGLVTWLELMNEVRRRADLNNDGIVTQEEMQNAMASGAFGAREIGSRPPAKRRK